MDEVIKKIIAIEEQAQELIRDAKNGRNNLDETIKKEMSDMESDMKKKLSEKEQALKSYEDNDAEEKVKKIKEMLDASMEKIEKIYLENKEAWIRDIVLNVTK